MKYLMPTVIVLGLTGFFCMSGCYKYNNRPTKTYTMNLEEGDKIKVPTKDGRILTIELEKK